MSEARKVTLGRGLSFLLEKSAEEKRKDNLKKYFLDPNCIESLQDEIIRLKTELEGIQVNTKTEYNEIPKKDKRFNNSKIKDGEYYRIKEATQRFDNSKIKDELLYTIKEASKLSHISCRTLTRRCAKNSLKKTDSRYLISGKMLKEWVNIPINKTKNHSDSFFESSNITYNNTKTYLIKNRRNGFYKIGRSKDPLKREQTLQSEEPDIVMVKTWDKDIESLLHKDYKDYRVRGEWFELSKVQVKYICTKYERG